MRFVKRRRELKSQLKLRDGGAGSDLNGLDDEVGCYDNDQADDSAGERAFGSLKFFLIAAGKKEIKSAHKKHDKEGNAGESEHSLYEVSK